MPDKKYILNLNNYRNWNFHVSNNIKRQYTSVMADQMAALQDDCKHIALTFQYFKATKRKCDRANIYCIHEKFFCDALVKYRVIEDDSDRFIIRSTYLPVRLDKANPRVEVQIDANF